MGETSNNILIYNLEEINSPIIYLSPYSSNICGLCSSSKYSVASSPATVNIIVDPPGHTLTWLLYELCKNPKYKQKLIKEIDNYWLNNGVENYDTFNELPFMTKCITETLRLWPALANGTYRELEFDEKIRGIDGNLVNVPKGTYCQIINWTRHRNKQLWGDDCNIFNPNRDFKDSEIWSYDGFGTYNISSDRFSPFTYGPRNCIGKNFSHMEMRLILLNIFKNYDFNLNKDQLMLTDYKKYKGINLFTLGPQSIKNDELLGMYVDIIPRKSKIKKKI